MKAGPVITCHLMSSLNVPVIVQLPSVLSVYAEVVLACILFVYMSFSEATYQKVPKLSV